MRGSVVRIYCDGSVGRGSGAGGWAAVIRWRGKEKVVSGYVDDGASVRRMKMCAALYGMMAVRSGDGWTVKVYSDAVELIEGLGSSGKYDDWVRNDWKGAGGDEELWIGLHSIASQWHHGRVEFILAESEPARSGLLAARRAATAARKGGPGAVQDA